MAGRVCCVLLLLVSVSAYVHCGTLGEDHHLLQEAIRLAMEKNSEFPALREEVQNLKSEVEKLRSGNKAKNDHLTVQWVAGSVGELRAEVAELSSSVNRTEELAAREALAEAVRLVRRDMTTLRRDLDLLKAESEARLSVLADDLRDLSHKCDHYKDEIEENSIIQEHKMSPEDNRRYRHQRLLKKRVESLTRGQARLEQQLKSLAGRTRTPQPGVVQGDLAIRVTRLETSDRQGSKALFNVTRQVAGLNKLHMSMLELLESVEALESKVDSTVPEFRKEFSQLEFNMAQLTSTVNIVREDQENQRNSLKAMGGAMSAMQEKLDLDHAQIMGLQTLWTNFSAGNHSLWHHGTEDQPLTKQQHSSQLPSLITRLNNIVKEYDLIIADLPHECSSVDGPSGLYIVAPGRSRPLVTFCDQTTGAGGWTIVQRRLDGSQEFNKNWQEYANGFGSPLGEFWIGNEALHDLTADNTSSLRIDLVDIYGKAWYAEYDEFSVGNATDGYRLTVSSYHGNASDALDYQNHMQFSSIDSDRDVSNTHCAANYEGGWWFSHCQHANLNGRYNLGLTWFDASRNEWIAVARSEMKVRSRHNHRTLL